MTILIASLIVLGLIFLLIEIFFIPGTTAVGLVGSIMMIIGIVVTYRYFGQTVGFYVLSATVLVSGVSLYLSFKTNVWKRFALKNTMAGGVNEKVYDKLKVGEEGVTVSVVKPIGNAEFSGAIVEVKSLGDYVENGTRVKIIAIDKNEITVEAI
jgi:membrane-bound ClpP family serine protease